MTNKANLYTDYDRVPDLAKFPELVLLNRFDWLVSLLYLVANYALGAWLAVAYPELGTNGWQMLVWGGFISTTVLMHGTVTINSLAHVFGTQRYDTGDTSRNNFWLALITMGEGWHNNHHFYQSSVRQGHRWWEIDATFYVLKLMSWVGLVWDLKEVPMQALEQKMSKQQARQAA